MSNPHTGYLPGRSPSQHYSVNTHPSNMSSYNTSNMSSCNHNNMSSYSASNLSSYDISNMSSFNHSNLSSYNANNMFVTTASYSLGTSRSSQARRLAMQTSNSTMRDLSRSPSLSRARSEVIALFSWKSLNTMKRQIIPVWHWNFAFCEGFQPFWPS